VQILGLDLSGGPMRTPNLRALALLALLVPAAATAAAKAPVARPPASATPAAGRLQLGFAKRAITPEPGTKSVYLAGFGNDRKATGVHDALWARAAAVSDGTRRIVLVSLDLIGFFHRDVEEARALFQQKAPGAELVVASTHDHEGPDTMGLWGESHFSSGVDKAYLERVRRAVAETAVEALGRLRPARLVLARTRTPGLIVDSRLPTVIDDELVVLQAVGDDGATLGTIVNWSSHPEALGGHNTRITSDYVHYLRERMEGSLGGTAVFLVASIGGLMTPLGLKLSDASGRAIPADSVELAQAVGERAADAALQALRSTGRPSASSALDYRRAIVFVPLQNRLFRLAMFLGVLDRRVYSSGRPATSLFGDDLRTEIGDLRLGDAEMLCVPGEIYPELVIGGIQDPQDPGADFQGAPRERPLKALMTSEYKMILGLADDEIGYIIPRSEWDERAPFAYGRKESQYGEENSVGPSAASTLADAFAKLLGR
jgi:hypothetical protein